MYTLKELIDSAGGITAISRKLTDHGKKTSPQCVSGWIRRGKIPENMIWSFCFATGLTPNEVRPDLFPSPEDYWRKTQEIIDARQKDC